MYSKVYFLIDGEELFLDQVLVEDELVPVFYICKSAKKERFLVLCTDEELETYILTKISKLQICDLLQGKISMRDAILRESFFWDVQVGENVESDVVNQKDMCEVPIELLPYQDSYYEIPNIEVQRYLEQISMEMLVDNDWMQMLSCPIEGIILNSDTVRKPPVFWGSKKYGKSFSFDSNRKENSFFNDISENMAEVKTWCGELYNTINIKTEEKNNETNSISEAA